MSALLVASVVLLWVLVLVLGVLVLALARQVGVLHERVAPAGALAMNPQLSVGSDAPVVRAERVGGEPLEVGAASADGRSTLLFFLSPTCPVCKTLLPALESVAARESDWLDVVLASDGEGHEAFIAEYGLARFPYLVSQELGMRYGVGKLPYATLVDGEGRIAAFGLVNSREHVESLFEAKERGVESIQDYLAQSRSAPLPRGAGAGRAGGPAER